MTFRRRTYPEVLDNILTGLVQGVAAEAHPYPPEEGAEPPHTHFLERPPVAEILSVYGQRNGQPHRFRADQDYKLADQKALVWQEGAQMPDAGTLVHVNYYPATAHPELTDTEPGSVLRTLSETLALEIGRLYAQLDAVYQAGFVDTAGGSALDKVVALLGIERVTGAHPAGEVVFTRSRNSRGAVTIPAGTRLITEDGEIEYETTATVTLLEGQNTVRVTARDLEVTNDPVGADALTVLPIPLAGIESVTNPNPTSITTQDESDAELRTRAKNFLHGSERATVGALQQAVARQGVSAEVIEDTTTPGQVTVKAVAEAWDPELEQRVMTAIHDARPAGVIVTLPTPETPRKVNVEILLTTAQGLLPEDLRAIQDAVRQEIADYFQRLPTKSEGSITKIVSLVLGVEGVEDMRLVSATWDGSTELAKVGTPTNVLDREAGALKIAGQATVLDEIQIVDPALPTLLSVTVGYPEGADAPDEAAIRQKLANTTLPYLNGLAEQTLPTAQAHKRVLSFGKLLHAIELPGKAAHLLSEYDEDQAATLPDETGIDPYQVTFALTTQSGVSRVLGQAADPAYTLSQFERLSLDSVTVSIEANDA